MTLINPFSNLKKAKIIAQIKRTCATVASNLLSAETIRDFIVLLLAMKLCNVQITAETVGNATPCQILDTGKCPKLVLLTAFWPSIDDAVN